MKLSLIICTHNPRGDYLQRVLGALQDQTLPKSEWELIVVDNHSDDPLANRVDLNWHPHGRTVREDKIGLSRARLRGIMESRGEVLVFADDDNVFDPGYLAESLSIGETWPQLGTWGGSIVPEFEVPPAHRLRPHLNMLALREVTHPRWSNVWNCKDAEPWGAGLCVRRRCALSYCDSYEKSDLRIDGRTGKLLSAGEDSEISFVACSLGMGMGVFPSLKVVHLIPARRLQDAYLAGVAQGLETSSVLLFYKWGGIRPGSPFSPLKIMRLLKHCLLDRGIERRLHVAQYLGQVAAARIIRSQAPKRSTL